MSARLPFAAFALFLFLLPVPGTLALRQFLLLSALGCTVFAWRRQGRSPDAFPRDSRVLLGGLAVITLWLLLQAAFISDETAWALKELVGQWLPALLAAGLGIGLARLRQADWTRQRMLGLLAACMLAQVLASLLAVLPLALEAGKFPESRTGFTAGKLEITYWNNLLLALLLVDAVSRWSKRGALTALPKAALFLGVAATLLSNLAFGARAGVIGAGLLIASLSLLVLWHERAKLGRWRLSAFLAVSLLALSSLAIVNYRTDARWEKFRETAEIAWSRQGGNAWLDFYTFPLPRLASGEPVEVSAYLRVAWIRAGVDLVTDYPLGVGYGRNAFGHALRKTVDTPVGHAHSGMIDWAVGTGWPGLALWLGLMLALLLGGLNRYFRRQDAAGLVLAFVVSGFVGRMAIDSINRDHMLILFFLVLGMLTALSEEATHS